MPAITSTNTAPIDPIKQRIKELGLSLPSAPAPVGNYTSFRCTKDLIFINQIALLDGKVLHPGTVEKDITIEQATEAVYVTMLNVLAVLDEAMDGRLSDVKQCVQLTGIFNTLADFQQHAHLMNAASDLVVSIYGESGKHARATLGAISLPLRSSVEIQAVFEK